MKRYEKIEGSEKEFKISVDYCKGGNNAWSGRNDERGYYLTVIVVSRTDYGNGVIVESYELYGGGLKKLILSVPRKSEKSYGKAVELSGEYVEIMKSKLAHKI